MLAGNLTSRFDGHRSAEDNRAGHKKKQELAMQIIKRARTVIGLWIYLVTPLIANAQSLGVGTLPGIEVGATVSHYRYEEPSLDVKLEGYKGGVDMSLVTQQTSDWFFRFEGRYEYGNVDYTGSGTKDNNPDWYAEARVLAGRDFDRNTYGLSPYIGVGYRYLYNDIRGVTSTGAIGYTRTSQYTYIPLGVTHRLKLAPRARLATTLEVDYLVHGRQTSTLSDFNPVFADITNNQRNGYGIRGSLYYEKDRWLVGPWFQYWNVNRSEVEPVIVTVAGTNFIIGTGFEPRNKTTEIGVRFAYRF